MPASKRGIRGGHPGSARSSSGSVGHSGVVHHGGGSSGSIEPRPKPICYSKDTPDNVNCGTCIFIESNRQDFCRRFPIGQQHVISAPEDQWCGEHKLRAADAKE